MPEPHDDFRFQWNGNVVVISPATNVEQMRWDLIEQAADVLMAQLGAQEVPMVVWDLSEINYFGSVFLQLLLRCHTLVKKSGGEQVLCGVSPAASELLRLTNLDTIWAIYDTRDEAIEALSA